jgi:hypothetical protein
MKKTVAALSLLFVAGVPLSYAEGNKGAGCGIGKVIMEGKSDKGSNIVASILNMILIPNTFFMTSGVLGCDTTQTVERENVRNTFVASNLDSLSSDMAQGQGEHLAALADVMGINQQDNSAFFALTQARYSELFDQPTVEAGQVLAALDQAMSDDPLLSKYVK